MKKRPGSVKTLTTSVHAPRRAASVLIAPSTGDQVAKRKKEISGGLALAPIGKQGPKNIQGKNALVARPSFG